MATKQMYFSPNRTIRYKINYLAKTLNVPDSCIVNLLLSKILSKPNLNLSLKIPSMPKISKTDIERTAKAVSKGYTGEKHSLID